MSLPSLLPSPCRTPIARPITCTRSKAPATIRETGERRNAGALTASRSLNRSRVSTKWRRPESKKMFAELLRLATVLISLHGTQVIRSSRATSTKLDLRRPRFELCSARPRTWCLASAGATPPSSRYTRAATASTSPLLPLRGSASIGTASSAWKPSRTRKTTRPLSPTLRATSLKPANEHFAASAANSAAPD
jgi:hypothetical protein